PLSATAAPPGRGPHAAPHSPRRKRGRQFRLAQVARGDREDMRRRPRGSTLIDQPGEVFTAVPDAPSRRPILETPTDRGTNLRCALYGVLRAVDVVQQVHHHRVPPVTARVLQP